MIYFDNASTGGFKPDGVINAAASSLKACANAGRGAHALAAGCAERVYAVRVLLSDFFGAPTPDRVVFTKNCTEALNIALLGGLKARDKVVATVAEHNSVLRPLKYLQSKGVAVEYAPVTFDGQIDTERLISLSQGAAMVCVTLASNVTGAAPDIAAIKGGIPKETLLVCDGAQYCGHMQIDIGNAGIDALALSGHRGMFGIQGGGALILSKRFNPAPCLFGATGSEASSADMPSFYPDRLEAGTLSYPAIVALGEGALYLKSHMRENAERLLYLTDLLIKRLSALRFVKLYSRVNPFGIVSFSVKGQDSSLVAARLSDEYSVCVSGGLLCAPLMLGALGESSLVRASLSAFNTEIEIDYFIRALKGIYTSA